MTSPRSNRSWLPYFLALGILTIVAIATLATYNIRQQLKPETVDLAIAKWKQIGPADYVLVYTAKKSEVSGEMIDHYVVKVKDRRAHEVLVNGIPLDDEKLAHYGMHRLLQNVERFMELDAEPGKPKVYVRGDFDAKTGGLLRFVRRVMGTRQRLEIVVESLEYQSKKEPESSNK